MGKTSNRRRNPRLHASYPIRISQDSEDLSAALGRSVTRNLCSRGAYFRTFHGEPFQVGRQVEVAITVPHRFAAGEQEVLLDLRGAGEVVRVEDPSQHRTYGENGLPLTGIAIAFRKPLEFQYGWM